jgi:hypothetical protein
MKYGRSYRQRLSRENSRRTHQQFPYRPSLPETVQCLRENLSQGDIKGVILC